MITDAFNGNFGLFKIKKIVNRKSRAYDFYKISFDDDGRKLYACELHTFLSSSGESKKSSNLKSGDEIWIDVHAFSADGSLK